MITQLFENDTKRNQVINAILNNDFKSALRIAKDFFTGFSKEEISQLRRGFEIYNNEKFYKQLGFDKETEILKAVSILKNKFNIK